MGGQIELALSTAILLEYEEVAAAMYGSVFAREVMHFLDLAAASGFIRHFTPQFDFRIIAAEAEYIITKDRHCEALRNAGDTPQPITPDEFIRQFLSPS